MKAILRSFICFLCVFQLLCVEVVVNAEEVVDTESTADGTVEIIAPSAVLMEASTGTILYDKDGDKQLAPASVTKVMTLLLIFEALDGGKIQLDDEVTVSEHAASMGGSQVFLEVGEIQSVDTMIKCITVSSANDACVAMAEFLSGTEDEFVNQMNQKAQALEMINTNFVNCNGLDAEGHLTTAHDIAIMSRELITKHPEIYNYTSIWMENITHVTTKGTSEFGLSSTNKLMKQYEYATGLKTGSTSQALFCLSATANKNDMDMIAVIMAAPTSKERNQDATILLEYGFQKCQKYQESENLQYKDIEIKDGVEDTISGKVEGKFSYIDTKGNDMTQIKKTPVINDNLIAPIGIGDKIGEVEYRIGDEVIGAVDILSTVNVEKINYKASIIEILHQYLL